MENRPKVFISYTMQDTETANIILNRLQQAGFEPWNTPIESDSLYLIKSNIRNQIYSSDYFIVLISQESLDSSWVQYEMEQAISKEWLQREITVLPIKIKPCNMPTYLKKLQWLDLSKNFEKGLEKMIEQLKTALRIDLRKGNELDLYNLTIDLLKAYGFKDVKKHSFGSDWGYDLIGHYPRKDPFGRTEDEMWAIEIKSTKLTTELSSLRKFIAALAMFNEPVRGLFVTSGQLSSDAKAWLNQQKNKMESPISVLDGNDLKRLLLKKKHLVAKYFNR